MKPYDYPTGGSEVDRLKAACHEVDAKLQRALRERNAAVARAEAAEARLAAVFDLADAYDMPGTWAVAQRIRAAAGGVVPEPPRATTEFDRAMEQVNVTIHADPEPLVAALRKLNAARDRESRAVPPEGE